MYINPSKAYPAVFIFSIGQKIKERNNFYEATRKYWAQVKKYADLPSMIAVGLINQKVFGVYRIDKWKLTDNPEYIGRHEFTGHTETELTEEFLNKDFSLVIEPHKGYWRQQQWLVVNFDGNGHFKFLRPTTRSSEEFLCTNTTISSKQVKKIEAIDYVGKEIRDKIREIGKLWNNSPNKRIFPEPAYSNWSELIKFWKDCPELPLIVRKNTEHKGESVIHPSGREIIFADNSFATWVICNVLENKSISLIEIKKLLDNDEIPFMMVANKNAKYKKKQAPNITDGWKLCHKEEVGFKTRKSVLEIDIETIKKKFFLYANPKNMFLLPKDIGGIGEIKEFIEEQKD